MNKDNYTVNFTYKSGPYNQEKFIQTLKLMLSNWLKEQDQQSATLKIQHIDN